MDNDFVMAVSKVFKISKPTSDLDVLGWILQTGVAKLRDLNHKA